MLNIKIRIFCLLASLIIGFHPTNESILINLEVKQKIAKDVIRVNKKRPNIKINTIVCKKEEIPLEDLNMIAQLVQAEAGNQNMTGKRYVVDVVLNRIDSEEFPDTVEGVIFQNNQFSVIKNGAFNRAKHNISKECYEAVKLEYKERLNYNILYFSRGKSEYMRNPFKHQDHWFG